MTSDWLFNFLRDNRGLPVRSMTIFNFLLEASLCGAILILIVLLVRRFLRGKIGNRAVYFAWLLVAIRLLVPLALPNPAMNELRPTLSTDKGARPIADQIRVRFSDAMSDIAWAIQPEYETVVKADGKKERVPQGDPTLANFIQKVGAYTSYGFTGKWFLIGYFIVDGGVLCYMAFVNVRFRRRLKKGRVSSLDGEALKRYLEICEQRKLKPLPVYYVDPLPSACLVGVIKPYIALPLTLKNGEVAQVLTHELCHHKAHDEWWGVVRNLCCVVHWFNPLVWIAARCVRTDCEMACDDRVIAPMSDEERLKYANTLVLAAARRNAPRMSVLATGMTMTGKRLKRRISAIIRNPKVQRWAVITVVAVVMCLTILAFGTAEDRSGEYDAQLERAKLLWVPDEPFEHPVPEVEPFGGVSIQTDAEALDYAKRMLQTPYMRTPEADIARLEVSRLGDIWRASISGNRYIDGLGVDNGCELYFTTSGVLIYYDARIYKSYVYVDYEITDSQRATVDAYMRGYAKAYLGDPYIDALVLDSQAYETDGRFAFGRALDNKGVAFFYILDMTKMKVIQLENFNAGIENGVPYYPTLISTFRSDLLETSRYGAITPMDVELGSFDARRIDDEGALCVRLRLPAEGLSKSALYDLKNLYGVRSEYELEALWTQVSYNREYYTAEAYLNRDKPMITEDAAKAVAIKVINEALSIPEGLIGISTIIGNDSYDKYEVNFYTKNDRSVGSDRSAPWGMVYVNRHTGEPLQITILTNSGYDRYITPNTLAPSAEDTPLPTVAPTPLPTATPEPAPTPAPTVISLAEENGDMLRFTVHFYKYDNDGYAEPVYGEPKDGDVPLGEAIEVAVRAICDKAGMSRAELESATENVTSCFFIGDHINGASCWCFNFIFANRIDVYTVTVNSPEGKMVDIYGPNESNG